MAFTPRARTVRLGAARVVRAVLHLVALGVRERTMAARCTLLLLLRGAPRKSREAVITGGVRRVLLPSWGGNCCAWVVICLKLTNKKFEFS